MTEDSQLSFAELGLSEQMLKAVASKGFEQPTPIQRLAIPKLLTRAGDMIAQSQTGTGKTAAFGLPIIQQLSPTGKIRAVVLVPTRELALQVTEELISYNHETKLSIAAIYGGASMSEQLRRLSRGIDIMVGTPGRVLDHIRRSTIDLTGVEFVVLDEADEMLDMGFIEDVEEILGHVAHERRVMLFSATMPDRIIELSKKAMHDTEIVRVESQQLTTDLTDQIYFEVRESDKFDALTRIIDIQPEFYGIVFCRTKVGVDEITNRLIERGYAAEALHGDISQAQREKILRKFKAKQTNILIATDVAARGIDVNNLTHVINYSLPQDSDSYVHRIGRTGRAGNNGTAITFISKSELRQFGYLQRNIKVDIKREQLPSPQDIVQMKRSRIKDDLQEIISNDSFGNYTDVAGELLSQYRPETALAALLKLAFQNELDEANYPEIRSFSVDRRGTARLFIGIGRNDGYDARRLIALLKKECGLRDKEIDDLRMFDTFSFVTIPFAEAEESIRRLNRTSRGSRPLAKIANEEPGKKQPRTDAPRNDFDQTAPKPAPKPSTRPAAKSADEKPRYARTQKPEYAEPKPQRKPTVATPRYDRSEAKPAARPSERNFDTRTPRRSDSAPKARRSDSAPKLRRGHADTYSASEMKAKYYPDEEANKSFDWSVFENGGNTWGKEERRKKR
ncbi:MAG: DEAD/DEAH box helicase [Tidjanibacter sp.]|nr:DEAD/DEAH box helicase [Tidjanibacter sp.]